MRVKFVRQVQFENEGRNKGPVFAEGGVYDFTEEFGQRWVQRGDAEIIDADVRVEVDNYEPVDREAPKPDRIERRGAMWFAMAGEERLGKGMTKEAASEFASEHELADATQPPPGEQ